jgi:cation transport protein ChaC
MSGITFTINCAAPNYVRFVSEAATAQTIATACWVLGSCGDYLFDTIHGLEGFEIHDHRLNRIARFIREHRD